MNQIQRLVRSSELVREAASQLHVEIPNLERASEISIHNIVDAQEAALDELKRLYGKPQVPPHPIDIVVMGSMGRGEMSSSESDFDYILLSYGMVTDPYDIWAYRTAADVAERAIQPKPTGKTTGFGGLSSSTNLVNLIGLDADTNINHTHRILLLQESRSLLDDPQHDDLVTAVLRRYLYDYLSRGDGIDRRKRGVPRFLLNDVVRYWRTLAVDYQAKRWMELHGEKWGMRYLKLRSTRKLGFAGTLVSLFIPRISNEYVTVEFLKEQFELTALARFVQVLQYTDDPKVQGRIRDVLFLADHFAHLFGREDVRKDVNSVQHPRDSEINPTFQSARQATQRLESALEDVFLSTAPLIGAPPMDDAPLTMRLLTARYLLF